MAGMWVVYLASQRAGWKAAYLVEHWASRMVDKKATQTEQRKGKRKVGQWVGYLVQHWGLRWVDLRAAQMGADWEQ